VCNADKKSTEKPRASHHNPPNPRQFVRVWDWTRTIAFLLSHNN
jgi:hypothetical protein